MPGMLADRAVRTVRNGLRNGLHVWGIGDHGGGLSRLQLGILERYRDRPVMPTIRFGTMCGLLAAVEEEGAALPGNRGETYNLFEGCFTTHASIKRLNRRCEGALLAAEALAAVAGLDRNAVLRDAWTGALFKPFSRHHGRCRGARHVRGRAPARGAQPAGRAAGEPGSAARAGAAGAGRVHADGGQPARVRAHGAGACRAACRHGVPGGRGRVLLARPAGGA